MIRQLLRAGAPHEPRLIARISACLSASLFLVGGCASSVGSVAGPSATPVERPAIPTGWRTLASGDGRVELVVPPDLSNLQEPSGVLVQAEFNGVATPVQVWVIGPSALQDQPGGGESAREWLVRTGWLPQPGSGGVTTVSDESDGEIVLPAGLAYRAALTADAGTETASRVIVYAIRTSTGVTVMQIVGEPGTVQARTDELKLVALLARFSE